MKFQGAGILLALLDYPFIENECVSSFMALYEYSKYLCPGNTWPRNDIDFALVDGTSPARAHNHAVQAMLDDPKYKSLLIVGRDHIFKPDALQILYEADKDMIGGITCQRVRALETLDRPILTIVNAYKEGQSKPLSRLECLQKIKEERGQPFQVPSMGDGLMLFKRKVFEKLSRPWFYEPPIPEEKVKPGMLRGTVGCDIVFFENAKNAGFEIWAHPDVQYVHIGRGYTAVHYDITNPHTGEM